MGLMKMLAGLVRRVRPRRNYSITKMPGGGHVCISHLDGDGPDALFYDFERRQLAMIAKAFGSRGINVPLSFDIENHEFGTRKGAVPARPFLTDPSGRNSE